VTVLGETRGALTAAVLVVAVAARLLVRHLPALLTVFLLGLAARNGAMWAAVYLGRDHPVLASLLVPLAPLSMVVTLVVMLRIAGGPLVASVADGTTSRRAAVLSSALIPFLTVYTLTGELKADRDQFINESYADEIFNSDSFATTGHIAARTLFDETSWQIAVIVGVILLRVVIDLLDLADRHPGWGLAQVVVEVTWLTWFANLITREWDDAKDWAGDLVVVDRVQDAWHSVTGWFGPLTSPLRAAGDLAVDAFDRAGAVVVTPVVWLAVGAVVIAGGLPADRRARLELPAQARQLHERVAARLGRTRRSRVRAKALELAGRRFEDLVDGLRILAHAGLLPVLAFCLVLPLAEVAELGTALGLRMLLGPQDPDTMIFFAAYPQILTRAAYTLVVVVVVVAAVDRLLLRRPGSEPATVDPAPVSAD
jgi:hypothetical protein